MAASKIHSLNGLGRCKTTGPATVGAQLDFVPDMFKALASNPAVLEVVATLQGTLSRVLDAKTRHTIALAVSQSNGCVAKRRRETMRHAWQDTT